MLCFFNLAGAIYDPAAVGMEMASLSEARKQAAIFMGEVIRDAPDAVWEGEEVRVEVTDQNRLILFAIITLGIDAPNVSGSAWLGT